MSLLDGMVSISLKHDGVSYNTLINGCNGRIHEGLTMSRARLCKGIKAGVISHSIILEGLFRLGRLFLQRGSMSGCLSVEYAWMLSCTA